MTLPIDRTNLTAAQTNQVPNALLRSALNIAALTTPYDTIDELNTKVDANHAAGAVGTTQLADLSVTSAKLAASAVTTAKIADSNITLAKMADASVGTAELVDLSVTTAKIAIGAVGVSQLSPAAAVNETVNNALIVALSAETVTGIYNAVTGYGADPTGVSDSYAALIALAADVSSAGGGFVYFPPGDYYIGQYKITAGVNQNTITDIIFQNCNGLLISGYGAKVSVKGNFNRAADSGTTSYSNSVIPFEFVNCTNFELCGFELDGNVDLMTKAPTVIEGRCHGIATYNCSNYYFHNMYIHHFACDGVYIGGDTTPIADRNMYMNNVKSLNNARQGMSIIQLRGGTITNCLFKDIGTTGGSYGSHSPASGVDIEPNYAYPTVDIMTGDITFIGCRFENNQGSQFQAIYANLVEKIYLRSCDVLSGNSTSSYPFILSVKGGVIESSYLNMGAYSAYLSWNSPNHVDQVTTMRDCEINTSGQGITTVTNNRVTIENTRIIGMHTGAHTTFMPYIQNTKAVFKNNYIFLPSAAYAGSGTYDEAVLIQNTRVCRDNFYETDMNPAASQHFATSYSTGNKLVQNETYLSAGAGNTGFRPWFNSLLSNAFPFSYGAAAAGNGVLLTDFGSENHYQNKIVFTQAMPTTGSWRVGDIAFDATPSKSGKIGWTRLTTGTGNVLNTDWQPFGAIDA